MTSLMGGEQGFKNVTFERYVLGAILDEVMYAANLRLQKMSRSRYSLERSDYTGWWSWQTKALIWQLWMLSRVNQDQRTHCPVVKHFWHRWPLPWG